MLNVVKFAVVHLWTCLAALAINLSPVVAQPDGLLGAIQAECTTFDEAAGQAGMVTGNLTYAAGINGRAFVFDGTTEIAFAAHPLGNLDRGDFTIAFWLMSDQGRCEVLSKRQHCSLVPMLNVRVTSARGLLFETADPELPVDGGSYSAVTRPGVLADGAWHSIVWTRSATLQKVYVDGVLDGVFEFPGVGPIPSPGHLYLGTGHPDPCFSRFVGGLDAIMFFNRALTAAEVTSLYNSVPDFNHDGRVDPDDLADFITCFFSTPICATADFNVDGNVDPDDLADFITAFFAGCP